MRKLNINLIKAGLHHLINTDLNTFIDNLSVYISNRENLINYLMEGQLPINDEVKKKIENYIKNNIPCVEDFIEIVDIKLEFDYSDEQQYCVTYKANRYYTTDKQPYNGNPVKDEDHPMCIVTDQIIYINNSNLKTI